MIKTPSNRILSWDVFAVLGYAAAVIPLQWIGLPSPIMIVILAPGLLFLPGFTLSTVLFPGRPTEDGSSTGGGLPFRPFSSHGNAGWRRDDGIARLGLLERAALSVGVSVALLPLFAFVFNLLLGVVVGPIVVVTSIFSAAMVLLGGIQRARLPESDRFDVPIERWVEESIVAVTGDSTRTTVLNVVLAVSVVLAIGAIGIAFAVPQHGERFTEFAVGTEQDGEFVIDDYPEDLTAGEPAEMAVLIENNEGEPIEYHVVARFERVQDGTVLEVEDAGEFTVTVEPGETVIESHSAAPSMTGEDLRLRFLLFLEEPPADTPAESAYRSVHVWITVE